MYWQHCHVVLGEIGYIIIRLNKILYYKSDDNKTMMAALKLMSSSSMTIIYTLYINVLFFL